MGSLVAGQDARVAAAIVGNRGAVVLSHYVGVKVHEALPGNTRGNRAHSVRRMADRAGKTILRDVVAVLEKTGVCNHIAQAVALGAHAIRPIEAEVWIRKRVGNQSSGRGRLAKLIVVFEDVGIHRTVRTVRPGDGPAKYCINREDIAVRRAV